MDDMLDALRYLMWSVHDDMHTPVDGPLEMWGLSAMFPGYGAPKYYMPDGTKTTTRPKDGEKFAKFDAATGTYEEWMWDDVDGQWHNISSGKPNAKNTATFLFPPMICPMDLDGLYDNSGMEDVSAYAQPPPIKCECGAAAVGSDRHSTWCMKFSAQP